MSKTFRISFWLLSAAIFCFSGCSSVSQKKAAAAAERKNIITAELVNLRRSDANIADIQSVELLTFKAQPIYSLNKRLTESSKTGNDNSQINTMYDRFGNKTEMRCLENDPLVRGVILKTSLAGQKQAVVFGKNGEVKRLPIEMSEKAMTADASIIASVAGIYELPKLEPIKAEPFITDNAKPLSELMPAVLPTPEIAVADTAPKTTAEAVKPEEKSETKRTNIKQIDAEQLPVKLPEANKDQPVKIKVDSLWLNNNPPKKKKIVTELLNGSANDSKD